jgi:hypothetical protein
MVSTFFGKAIRRPLEKTELETILQQNWGLKRRCRELFSHGQIHLGDDAVKVLCISTIVSIYLLIVVVHAPAIMPKIILCCFKASVAEYFRHPSLLIHDGGKFVGHSLNELFVLCHTLEKLFYPLE